MTPEVRRHAKAWSCGTISRKLATRMCIRKLAEHLTCRHGSRDQADRRKSRLMPNEKTAERRYAASSSTTWTPIAVTAGTSGMGMLTTAGDDRGGAPDVEDDHPDLAKNNDHYAAHIVSELFR